MIKLIALDLDGTLLREDKTISERNKEALRKVKEKGVKVVITTGRPLKAIEHILDELNLREKGDLSITFNGGLIQKNDTGEILSKKSMSIEEIHAVVQETAPFEIPIDILNDANVLQLPCKNKSWYQNANPHLTFHPISINDLNEKTVYNKIVSAFTPEVLDDAVVHFNPSFKEKFEVIKSRDMLLEFMPKGITKAYGLQQLCDLLSITPEEILACGDEENDLPMIEFAGIGVAMANSVPVILQASDFVSTSNMNDGVAVAVEKFVL